MFQPGPQLEKATKQTALRKYCIRRFGWTIQRVGGFPGPLQKLPRTRVLHKRGGRYETSRQTCTGYNYYRILALPVGLMIQPALRGTMHFGCRYEI